MIGGEDVYIEVPGLPVLNDYVQVVLKYWPSGIVESVNEREVLVYRDQESLELWTEYGAVAAGYNSMIHLLAQTGLLTVVVDEADDPQITPILREIQTNGFRDKN